MIIRECGLICLSDIADGNIDIAMSKIKDKKIEPFMFGCVLRAGEGGYVMYIKERRIEADHRQGKRSHEMKEGAHKK